MQRILGLAGAGILCAVALGLASPQARASSIGVYFANDASDCDAIQPAFSPLNWFVLAVLNGTDAVHDGIAGAAFRVAGVPPSWFHSPTLSPIANVTSPGNPLQEGVEIGFPVCQNPPNGVVLLYTITSFSISQINNLVYDVLPPLLSNDAGYEHPVLIDCDSPTFTRICVAGTAGFVNGQSCSHREPPPPGVECATVGVEPYTWGGVKTLYRE